MNSAEIVATPTPALVDSYRKAAIAYGEAIAAGRHRVANRSYDLLMEIQRELETRKKESGSALEALLCDEEPAVRLWAATHIAERLPVDANKTLAALADGPPSPLRIMAEIALSEIRRRNQV